MDGFYFPKIPVLRISGVGVEGRKITLSLRYPISSATPVPVAIVLLVPRAAGGILSALSLEEYLLPLKMFNGMTEEKGLLTIKGRKLCQKGSWKMRMTRWILGGSSEVK
ncbi:hypothetical protein Fot_28638 [Forsythia ovata]|uniref:Uncharacterized protein n=1 Tax=Forsythia ovata TaxID=205694 RepID=A0ABD1TPP2_9LAMI